VTVNRNLMYFIDGVIPLAPSNFLRNILGPAFRDF
jgi:hypothetical protein